MNFLESLTAEYFRMKGYMAENLIARPVKGGKWSDIDVVAYNEKELIIIECAMYPVSRGNTAKSVNIALEKFNASEEHLLQNKYPWLKTKNIAVKRMFCTCDRTAQKFRESIIDKDVEMLYLDDIVKEISKRIPEERGKVGKHPNDFVHFLAHLKKLDLLRD